MAASFYGTQPIYDAWRCSVISHLTLTATTLFSSVSIFMSVCLVHPWLLRNNHVTATPLP
jgi:hypothetical protein